MGFPTEHMVLQWTGSVKYGQSQGSSQIDIVTGSLRFAGPGLAAANNQQTLQALTVVLAGYWRDSVAAIPDNCWLESVKWNRVGRDGRYVAENTQEQLVTGVRGKLAPRYPLQVAWVTTWTTDAVRGKANKGRTYWPTAEALSVSSDISAPTSQAKATRDRQLISDLNIAARSAFVRAAVATSDLMSLFPGFTLGTADSGSGMTAMVMSKIGDGTARVITGASVGQRLDIQRRRANSQSDQHYGGDAPQTS